MSAFLCDDCHLTALAAYYYANKPALALGTTLGTFKLLRDENILSLEARYGTRDRWWEDNLTQQPRLCGRCEVGHFGTVERLVQIVKSASCYDYQACEHDGWPTSRACQIIEFITAHALGELAHELPQLRGLDTREQLDKLCVLNADAKSGTRKLYDLATWGWKPVHQ